MKIGSIKIEKRTDRVELNILDEAYSALHRVVGHSEFVRGATSSRDLVQRRTVLMAELTRLDLPDHVRIEKIQEYKEILKRLEAIRVERAIARVSGDGEGSRNFIRALKTAIVKRAVALLSEMPSDAEVSLSPEFERAILDYVNLTNTSSTSAAASNHAGESPQPELSEVGGAATAPPQSEDPISPGEQIA